MTRIPTADQPFDPAVHEAVIGDDVLRPESVAVGQAATPAE